jgi:hypothetical protein
MNIVDLITPDGSNIPKQYQSISDYWAYPDFVSVFDYNLGGMEGGHGSFEEVAGNEYGLIHQTAAGCKYWVKHLHRLTSLKYLRIKGRVTLPMIEALAALPAIEKLDIDLYTSTSITPLFRLTNLTHLFLSYSKPELNIEGLGDLPKLQSLSLSVPKKMGDIDHIQTFVNSPMRYLGIGGSPLAADSSITSLAPISSLQQLEYLSIANVTAKDKSLIFLHDMPNLKAIHVSGKLSRWKIT